MKEKFRVFMQGRYGIDELNQVLSRLGTALVIVALLFRKDAYAKVFSGLACLLLLWMLFRMCSKNIEKRRGENYKYFVLKQNTLGRMRASKERAQGQRTHKYFDCPNCKQQVKVPRGHGKIVITCPVCKTEFEGET